LGGYVLLPRILDKGRASLAGKLGEYHYGGKGHGPAFFSTSSGSTKKLLKGEISKGFGDGDPACLGERQCQGRRGSHGKFSRGAITMSTARRTAMRKTITDFAKRSRQVQQDARGHPHVV